MLQLKNITKTYTAAGIDVKALQNVSINFRESEFFAILGQSGSGKTTMLNIIGGLDRYTSGQLIINGTPTDRYTDGDWDTYRNHSIGFVFQSYNLIPHQSVLANVELALTLSGVSKAERRRRAAEALGKVGLSAQLHKKPNQLSGGQMQRVAIARAIVNEPDILLADEPTGALDSETSVQIMEILKEISRDRLIIMVTHNPELAAKYATRTISLSDGKIIGDTDPLDDSAVPASEIPTADDAKKKKAKSKKEEKGVKKGKRSMSIFTALSLSLNNLSTKRGRTFMTSFAGSIGIIGIALIMALSNGIQLYINRVQEDTLSSYPISIQKETADFSSMISSLSGNKENGIQHELDAVYENRIMYDLMNSMMKVETSKNNLSAFKKYLDREMDPSKSTTGLYELAEIKYSYDIDLNIYTKDPSGKIVKSDYTALLSEMMSAMGMSSSAMSSMYQSSMSMGGGDIWTELLPGDGSLISDLIYTQYDVISGRWPEAYNEIVLVVDKNNEISDVALYALGLKSSNELTGAMQDYLSGKTNEDSGKSWSYDEIMNKEFRIVASPELYIAGNGEYTDMTKTDLGLESIFATGTPIKVVGILRQNEDAVSGMIGGSIGYTTALTEYIIDKTQSNALVISQLADKTTDVLTSLPFKNENTKELSTKEKAEAAIPLISALSDAEKAELYIDIMSVPSKEYIEMSISQFIGAATRETIEAAILEQNPQYADMIKNMDDETLFSYVRAALKAQLTEEYAAQMRAALGEVPINQLAEMLTKSELSEEQYAAIYDDLAPKTVSDSTYDERIKMLGYTTLDDPSAINIYASTFADKDLVAEIISSYNDSANEEDKISYTDYVKLLMSSITTIIDVISYVLIAFVAISLVVSSIMIGIITYISVLERTKEIGILRSIGASKRDVSRVFNAETLIIGFLSGAIGIGVTLLLCLPINAIIRSLSGISSIGASLPVVGALILVAISMVLTLVAGLIPASVAAKKDPVTALRSE